MQSSVLDAFDRSLLRVPLLVLDDHLKLVKKRVDRLIQLCESLVDIDVSYTLMMLQDCNNKTRSILSRLNARVVHLEQVHNSSGQDSAEVQSAALNTKLHRIVVDFLLRNSMFQSAKSIYTQAGFRDLVDVDVFSLLLSVLPALRNRHDCQPALDWCVEHRSKLRQLGNSLELQLRIQQFVELLKLSQIDQALLHAQQHFPKELNSHGELVGDAMLMLVLSYDGTIKLERLQHYFDESEWDLLAKEFELCVFQVYEKQHVPGKHPTILQEILTVGLSVLKQQCCGTEGRTNSNCPPCMSMFRDTVILSNANCSQSRLRCRLSGRILDDPTVPARAPVALPNGSVYSRAALLALAKQGRVVDPRTGKDFSINDIRPIYLL